MTLDEIKLRQQRVADAENELSQARVALRDAQAEYAEQEARKAGIIYGETLVTCRGKGSFFVMGFERWFLDKPNYRLAKVKKDGTPSSAGSGQYCVALDDLAVIK